MGGRVRPGRRAQLGGRGDHLGDPRRARGRGADAPATSPARTWSSSAAAPPTSPPGSPGAARGSTGVDVTEEQLATARRMQAEHGLEFPLIHASAEDVPLPDASFDLAVSEYGASIWCDPDLWIAEAARLLRPGGELVFLVNGTLLMLCLARRRAGRAGRHRAAAAVLRHAPVRVGRTTRRSTSTSATATGSALLTSHGFEVERLVELRRPGPRQRRATTCSRAEWARALAGRGDVEGAEGRVSAPAGAADPARLDLAAAARDPRSSSACRSRSSRRGTRSTTRRTPTRSSSSARTRRARRARSRPRRASGPVLGVDTTVVCGGRVYGKADERGGGGGDARRARRRARTRSSPASACSRPAGRSSRPRRRA